MAFDKVQFADLIRRMLKSLDPELASESAVQLLLGTAAQESKFGTALRQYGKCADPMNPSYGPAIGIFQMEPETFYWLREKYCGKYPDLANRMADDMEWDLRLAIIMARLRYRVVKPPLPAADDIEGMALYYKLFYNSFKGKATPEDFVKNYKKFVEG